MGQMTHQFPSDFRRPVFHSIVFPLGKGNRHWHEKHTCEWSIPLFVENISIEHFDCFCEALLVGAEPYIQPRPFPRGLCSNSEWDKYGTGRVGRARGGRGRRWCQVPLFLERTWLGMWRGDYWSSLRSGEGRMKVMKKKKKQGNKMLLLLLLIMMMMMMMMMMRRRRRRTTTTTSNRVQIFSSLLLHYPHPCTSRFSACCFQDKPTKGIPNPKVSILSATLEETNTGCLRTGAVAITYQRVLEVQKAQQTALQLGTFPFSRMIS